MFDYSSNVDSAAKSFLHQSQFRGINRRIFTRDAQIRSWGCHTGEMMSKEWRAATGTRMVGCNRKDAIHEARNYRSLSNLAASGPIRLSTLRLSVAVL